MTADGTISESTGESMKLPWESGMAFYPAFIPLEKKRLSDTVSGAAAVCRPSYAERNGAACRKMVFHMAFIQLDRSSLEKIQKSPAGLNGSVNPGRGVRFLFFIFAFLSGQISAASDTDPVKEETSAEQSENQTCISSGTDQIRKSRHNTCSGTRAYDQSDHNAR